MTGKHPTPTPERGRYINHSTPPPLLQDKIKRSEHNERKNDRNVVKVERSVYDYIVYDSSTVEKPFALALDNDPDVKIFFKIPSWFKIEASIGTYNPDWAVYLTRNGEEKLYFILETKGTTNLFNLSTPEQLKIHCGKKHFEALENGVEMQAVKGWSEWSEFKAQI